MITIKNHGMGIVPTPNHMFHVYCLCGWAGQGDCHDIGEAAFFFKAHLIMANGKDKDEA